jgi:hypothetical protein
MVNMMERVFRVGVPSIYLWQYFVACYKYDSVLLR